MNGVENEYAVDALKAWSEKNRVLFDRLGIKAQYRETPYGCANLQLDSEKYLIDICAWNHASCLDIETIDIATEASEFRHVGPCDSESEFNGYLEELVI